MKLQYVICWAMMLMWLAWVWVWLTPFPSFVSSFFLSFSCHFFPIIVNKSGAMWITTMFWYGLMRQARAIHVNEPRQQMKKEAKREQEITGMSPIMSRFGSVTSDGHGDLNVVKWSECCLNAKWDSWKFKATFSCDERLVSKWKIVSSFTHLHVISNLYDLLSSVDFWSRSFCFLFFFFLL